VFIESINNSSCNNQEIANLYDLGYSSINRRVIIMKLRISKEGKINKWIDKIKSLIKVWQYSLCLFINPNHVSNLPHRKPHLTRRVVWRAVFPVNPDIYSSGSDIRKHFTEVLYNQLKNSGSSNSSESICISILKDVISWT
jgi:hypothetical protein